MQKTILTSLMGKQWIQESKSKGLVSVDICSAYIRSEAFRYLFEDIFNSTAKIRVLARWNPSDLLAQASDLKTYEICKENDIDFYIMQDFHGKVYSLAPIGVLLGSFNLTNRGFSIFNTGNSEAGVLIENSQDSLEYCNQLFSNAIQVDDDLFDKISSFVESNIDLNVPNTTWSDEIANLVMPLSTRLTGKLLVSECFATTFSEFVTDKSSARLHDLSLLSIDEEHAHDLPILRSRFRNTKSFRWLVRSLEQQDVDVYFGKATALLQDELFDDPKPYRQDVKVLLVNLLSWIDGLGIEEISIDSPNHSQRLTLKK